MHNNYYLLKQLTPVLGQKLENMEFRTCFSQNKNELILGFSNEQEEFYIKAVLNPEFCCLTFPENFSRSRRNSVELFKEALGTKVISARQYLNERCFALQLENNFSMLFKMHGNRSNIILFENSKVISIFRNNLKKDNNLKLSELDRPIDQDYIAFQKANCNWETLFPTFGKLIKENLLNTSYYSEPCEGRWNIIQSILNQLNAGKFFITRLSSELTFSLFPVGDILHTHDHPIDALNHFYQLYSGSYYLEKEKETLKKVLERRLAQNQNYKNKSEVKLNELKTTSRNEELANIIMANLHQFNGDGEVYELFDFYHNQPVQITLRRGTTPQKLAENYYRKAKNQKLEINQLSENIEAKEEAIKTLNRHLKEINDIEHVKGLRQYIKDNGIVKENKEEVETLPYKEIAFEGYRILVGKNAKSNDLLIQNHAKKDDLWLHAKDCSGSHVIVKEKSGQNFPKNVIEKAAEIAAFHSKQKNDSLCPVIYTPRKYVRKIKGTPAGAVKVEKESVLLVRPSL